MKSIEIKKLFGRFDYKINLEPNLIIITGPNGFGKSTILKILHNLTQGILGLSFFYTVEFASIKVTLSSKKTIVIKKENNELLINKSKVISADFINRIEDRLRHRSFFRSKGNHLWLDRREDRIITTEAYILEQISKEEFERDLPFRENPISNAIRKTFILFDGFKKDVGNISLITEQRLLKENRNDDEVEVENVIESLPEKIQDLFVQVQKKYSNISSELDGSYPVRLFRNSSKITEKQFNENIAVFNDKFLKLNSYGLNINKTFGNVEFKDEHAKAFKVYFDDLKQKYTIYDEFIRKIEIYTSIVNNRLMFKKIKIDRENGLVVFDDNGKTLSLSQLSSGEKQEIVIFFDLIFGVEKDLLLLIDEPEISLHIAWQKKFIEDLQKIIEMKSLKVIVATHSPQIINNHWDIQVDLGEFYGK